MKRLVTITWVGAMILPVVWGCQRARPKLARNQSNGQARFRWLDRTRAPRVWNGVQAAFRNELAPDDPAKLKPHQLGDEYKYLYRIGVFKDAALVIVGHRLTKTGPGEDWFNSYSYNLRTGIKNEISLEKRNRGWASDGLDEFKVETPAQFAPSPTPDIVITYDDYSGCEAEHFLASFRYDSAANAWEPRQWGKENSLFLAADPEPDDEAVSFGYLFKIKDWNGDGFDEVAVRSREVDQVSKGRRKTYDSTELYAAKNGVMVGRPITDTQERKEINAELCRGSEVSFCKQQK